MKKLIATAVFGLTIALTPLSASAQYKGNSYFDAAWFQRMDQMRQINFAKIVVRNYSRINERYAFIINKYSRYSDRSWYKRIQSRYEWQENEIKKYNSIIGADTAPKVVRTYVEKVPGTIVKRGKTVTVTNNNVVEEKDGNTMREYAVTTVTRTTPVTTTYYTNHKTVSVYDNGKETYSNNVKIDKTETVNDVDTTVDRELIREYAIVVPPVEDEDDNPPPTTIVLTEAEYLARSDVDYTLGDSYYNAVKTMNSRINDNYIAKLGTYFGNNLDKIGAPAAWSRGYTGKGSTIAIFDTGIDTDHSEFEGKIKGLHCFTNVCERGLGTVEDGNRHGHGTHVAGIAAANLDGKGTTGVAYDADLLIGKLAYDSGYFQFDKVDEAMKWAVENGADVVNISAGTRTNSTYRNSLKEIGTGTYYADMTFGNYNVLGYNQMYSKDGHATAMIEAMKDHETVMVLASGNERLAVSGQETHIALDPVIGNRVLVVGMFDERYNDLSPWSNAAGTICRELKEDGTCKSDARISDRFLMAPGVYVAAPTINGGYTTLTGTSMAAPHVAGAVAIVHQMWPHMTGANLTKLLLNTASTDGIKNYDPNRHGQGLLDLDAATLPQGVVGIPTTGRITGNKVAVSSGTLALSAGSLSSLDEVMVVDDYDRDFYFNANDFTQVVDTRTTSNVRSAMYGFQPDNYIGYTSGQIVPMENVAFSINDDTGENTIVVMHEGFSLGLQNEKGSFLGNVADSELMRVYGAQTAYLGYQFDDGTFFGNAQLGATSLDVDSSTLMKKADTLMSYSASIGAKQTVGKSTWGATVSLPVTIASGKAHFEMASGVNNVGDLTYSNSSSSLASAKQEINYGMFFNTAVSERSSIEAFTEVRTNYASTNDDTIEVGVNYRISF